MRVVYFVLSWEKEYQKQLDPEMTTEQIKRIIDDIALLRSQVIYIYRRRTYSFDLI